MREFYGWIEDPKVSQLDASTEEVINNLKRQAARRRWKRAKSIISIGRMLDRRLSDEKLHKIVLQVMRVQILCPRWIH